MWTATGSMATERYTHTATLLPNGRVLVAGGTRRNLATVELYDPATGVWTATGSMATPRTRQTATLLPNGQVLVAGGFRIGGEHASVELYDPATGMWTATGSIPTDATIRHTAALLPNGQVLVAGGECPWCLARAEVYDPATGLWTATGSMATTRESHGDVDAEWAGPGGGWFWRRLWLLSKCRTIRSGDWDVDGDRQHGRCSLRTHGDVAAQRAGAGGRRSVQLQRLSER